MEISSAPAPTKFEKGDDGPKAFGKEGRDVHDDTWKTARDIGQVRLQHSRLNVFTNLSPGDTVDHFKFNTPSAGPLRLGGWNEETVHIQLLDSRGRVIADSSEDADKKAREAFAQLSSPVGFEDFQPGDYIIRVSRLDGEDATKDRPYGLQLQMGNQVKNDYDTTEYAAKAEVAPVAGVTLPEDPYTAGAQGTPATLAAQAINTMMTETNTHLDNVLRGAYSLFPPVR